MTTREKNMQNLNVPGGIPVDSDYGESSQFLEDDVADSAYSQASSIHNWRVEHGRRYWEYRDGHPFPYDDMTKQNEASLHELIYLLLDHKYFMSPMDESSLQHVADVGTGEGFWAEAVAERYPDIEVTGIDKMVRDRSVVPNCSWLQQDVTEEWILDQPATKFDLIHIRSLFVGVKDWQPVYAQCFEKMSSGGWIEQYEIEIDAQTEDDSELPGSEIRKLSDMVDEMARASGRDFKISSKMKELIEAAGFVDVQEQKVHLPLGPWASDPKFKEIGKFFEHFYTTGVQGWLMQICTRYLNMTPEEVNAKCNRACKEIEERNQHYYFPLVIVIGRKP